MWDCLLWPQVTFAFVGLWASVVWGTYQALVVTRTLSNTADSIWLQKAPQLADLCDREIT